MNAPVSIRQKVKLFGVEYNLTEHCNLSCYHCDHASPLMPRKFASLEDYERDIRAIAEAVHVEEFRIVGGEPLLHPQLLDFMRMARDIGIGEAPGLERGLVARRAARGASARRGAPEVFSVDE